MNLKSQVTNLKLSQRLKKLGVPQTSYWMWVKYELWDEPQIWQSDMAKGLKTACLSGEREWECSAFSCAELGVLLSHNIWKGQKEFWFNTAAMSHGFVVGYKSRKYGLLNDIEIGMPTEADARAKLLIYLIVNKLIDPKEMRLWIT